MGHVQEIEAVGLEPRIFLEYKVSEADGWKWDHSVFRSMSDARYTAYDLAENGVDVTIIRVRAAAAADRSLA